MPPFSYLELNLVVLLLLPLSQAPSTVCPIILYLKRVIYAHVLVVIPGATDDDDAIELAVPEQFVSKVDNGKLVTTFAEHV